MLLEILSGIDIHIRKIPTELLVALGIVSVVTQNISVYSVLFAVPTGFVFYFFRKRIGIGLYDILLIVLLGTTLQNPLIQLKFIAVILILWGMTGSILGALKNRKDLSIPLVPLITFSYYAVQTIL